MESSEPKENQKRAEIERTLSTERSKKSLDERRPANTWANTRAALAKCEPVSLTGLLVRIAVNRMASGYAEMQTIDSNLSAIVYNKFRPCSSRIDLIMVE